MPLQDERPDALVDRLRGQVRGLEEQLQRLVRTEQRLYYAQRDVGRQLRRVEALNLFAIEAARCHSEEEILHNAIGTFFSLFPYDQAVAFLRRADGGLVPVVSHSVKGREGLPLESAGARLPTSQFKLPGEVSFLMPTEFSAQPALVLEAVKHFEQLFGKGGPRVKSLVLPLRDGTDSPSLGFVLLRREGEVAFHEKLAGDEDRPFLELFGRHAATALTQFRLVQDLREACAHLAEAQEESVQHERLAALGQLAAVVAHEVRNPVAVIFNSVAGIRSNVTADAQKSQLLGVIAEEAERLDAMVSDLLDFARPNVPQLKPERLDLIVRRAMERALGASPNKELEIRVEVAPHTPHAIGDARMLHQAVLNLLTNSLQASRRGEAILVRLGREVRGDALLVRLEVVDRGPGIPAADLERVFDPFFTTKAMGSGLGLAVVKKVVEAHEGELRVVSRTGEGSVFTILIPAEDIEP